MKAFTAHTEVLTDKGWKRIKNVSEKDYLAFYTKENHRVVFDKPKGLSERDYDFSITKMKKDDVIIEIPSISIIPMVRKSKNKQSLICDYISNLKFTTNNSFITAGLVSSSRQIVTDYELFCIIENDFSWVKPSTLSYKMIDTVFDRIEFKETKTTKSIAVDSNKEVIQMLSALSGRTSKIKNKSLYITDTNVISSSGFTKEVVMYKGKVFAFDTNYQGVICKFGDFVVVL